MLTQIQNEYKQNNFNELKTNIMNDKVKELIELYEAILHGDKDEMGLFDCYDTYYVGCWDEKLNKVENLKKELVKN